MWKVGIYRAMGERELRVGEWNSGREWNVEVGRLRQTFQNRARYIGIWMDGMKDGWIYGWMDG